MISLTITSIVLIANSPTPFHLSLFILLCSFVSASLIFNSTATSWVSLILIIVFSSGMITLFIYVASLTPNENSNATYSMLLLPIVLIGFNSSLSNTSNSKTSINIFSEQALFILMTLILILTILTITIISFNPQQSISSTF